MAIANPFSLKVTLDSEEGVVTVSVREKDSDGNLHQIDSKDFSIDEVHADISGTVALYGLSKLLQDRSSDVKAGVDKLAAMTEVAQQLADGKWERERKAGSPTVSCEVEALAQLKGVDVGSIQKKLRTFSKEQRETILSHASIVELANQIRATREGSDDIDLADFAV